MDNGMKNVAAWLVLALTGFAWAGCQQTPVNDVEVDWAAEGAGRGGAPPAVAATAPVVAPVKVSEKGQPTRAQRLEIARRAEKLLAMKPTSDPGREFVNRMRTPGLMEVLAEIKDVENPIPKESLWKWTAFKDCVEMGELGPTWPVPERVKVPRVPVGTKVVMDGDLSDIAWEKAFTWTKTYKFNKREESRDTQTVWKLLWDADYLYLGFGCVDEDVVSTTRPHDEPVYRDDSVELFISPDERFRAYWEIVVNVDNSVFDATETKRLMEWGADAELDAHVKGLVTRVKREGPEGKPGYCVEMAVPWSAVLAQEGQRPRIGDVFSFMVARIQVGLRGRSQEAQGFAPVPLMGWGHNIWNRVKMELGE
jgi:hypothetical protein